MISNSKRKENSALKCVICRSVILDLTKIVQSRLNFSLICGKCIEKFPEDDLELMSNMFIAYGGYYGQISTFKFSLDNLIYAFIKDGERLDFKELNIKLLHKALLYGVSPKQFTAILAKKLNL